MLEFNLDTLESLSDKQEFKPVGHYLFLHLEHLNLQSTKFMLGGYVGYDLAAIHSKLRKTRLDMFGFLANKDPIFAIVDLLYFAHHDYLL